MSRFSTWLVSWVFVFGFPLDVVFPLVAVVVTEPLSTRHAHRLILLLVSVDRKVTTVTEWPKRTRPNPRNTKTKTAESSKLTRTIHPSSVNGVPMPASNQRYGKVWKKSERAARSVPPSSNFMEQPVIDKSKIMLRFSSQVVKLCLMAK